MYSWEFFSGVSEEECTGEALRMDARVAFARTGESGPPSVLLLRSLALVAAFRLELVSCPI